MKVLILECPVSTGGKGHEIAAKSIEEALKILDDKVNTMCICPVKKTSRTAKYVSFAYLRMIKHIPKVMGYLHNSRIAAKLTNSIRNRVDKVGYKRYKGIIDSFKPDAVVCTHAYPSWVVSYIKHREGLELPLVAVITDFYAHNYWPINYVTKYIVATKEAMDDFVSRGISSEKVEVLGIPISVKFSQQKNKEELKKKLGLSDNPVILVMGGGLGIGSLDKVVKSLQDIKGVQVIVVCGENAKLKRKLLRKEFRNKTLVYGYVDNIDELMEVADVAVTKSGGLTIAECLAKNVKMVIFKPIPGQEEKNADYLVKHKVAVKLNNEKHLPEAVRILLRKKPANNGIAKPSSAIDAAKMILKL